MNPIPPGSPSPGPRPAPVPVRPPTRLVVPSTAKRDTLIAIAIGLIVLALVGLGVWKLSQEQRTPSTNQLTGTIVAKHQVGQEKEITFGKKGLHSQVTDSGYSFDVRTDPGGRVYEVPVPKVQYDMYEVGAKYKFIKPPSEQQ